MFRFRHLRTSFIVGRGTLRRLVARYSGFQAHQIQFAYTHTGKPFLPQSDLRFNLSHSGDYLACVFAIGVEVGIDIEQIRRMEDLFDIAQRFFAEPEVRAIADAPPSEQPNLFFRIWTLKESFIKATGEGFGRPLDQFAVRMEPEPGIEMMGTSGDLNNWRIHSFCPAPGYMGGVAVEGNAVRLRWNTLEHEAIVEGE